VSVCCPPRALPPTIDIVTPFPMDANTDTVTIRGAHVLGVKGAGPRGRRASVVSSGTRGHVRHRLSASFSHSSVWLHSCRPKLWASARRFQVDRGRGRGECIHGCRAMRERTARIPGASKHRAGGGGVERGGGCQQEYVAATLRSMPVPSWGSLSSCRPAGVTHGIMQPVPPSSHTPPLSCRHTRDTPHLRFTVTTAHHHLRHGPANRRLQKHFNPCGGAA
jgi:hypothetical protein